MVLNSVDQDNPSVPKSLLSPINTETKVDDKRVHFIFGLSKIIIGVPLLFLTLNLYFFSGENTGLLEAYVKLLPQVNENLALYMLIPLFVGIFICMGVLRNNKAIISAKVLLIEMLFLDLVFLNTVIVSALLLNFYFGVNLR